MAERPRGFWTESKLDMLSAYLPAFTTASKRAPSTVYLDLFAGQATNVSRDTGRPIEGSLLRAVQTTPPFTVVRGFEMRDKRARSLQESFRAEYPDRDVVVHAGDVHHALQSALAALAKMRQEARARRRDRQEQEAGSGALFTHEELVRDAPLRAHESYQHTPPVPPYSQIIRDPGQ